MLPLLAPVCHLAPEMIARVLSAGERPLFPTQMTSLSFFAFPLPWGACGLTERRGEGCVYGTEKQSTAQHTHTLSQAAACILHFHTQQPFNMVPGALPRSLSPTQNHYSQIDATARTLSLPFFSPSLPTFCSSFLLFLPAGARLDFSYRPRLQQAARSVRAQKQNHIVPFIMQPLVTHTHRESESFPWDTKKV